MNPSTSAPQAQPPRCSAPLCHALATIVFYPRCRCIQPCQCKPRPTPYCERHAPNAIGAGRTEIIPKDSWPLPGKIGRRVHGMTMEASLFDTNKQDINCAASLVTSCEEIIAACVERFPELSVGGPVSDLDAPPATSEEAAERCNAGTFAWEDAVLTSNPPDEDWWTCRIGGRVAHLLPQGADFPLRMAVRRAFLQMTGVEDEVCSSGWGHRLTKRERESLERDRAARAAATPEAAKAEKK